MDGAEWCPSSSSEALIPTISIEKLAILLVFVVVVVVTAAVIIIISRRLTMISNKSNFAILSISLV